MTNPKPNADTYRLRALAYFAKRDVAQAAVAARQALEIDPTSIASRHLAAAISYYQALSPAAVPDGVRPWPEPIKWVLVKRDSDSLAHLRESAPVFRELASLSDLSKTERQAYGIWCLASLANDPERQEKAAEYARDLLQFAPETAGAIAWASARNYEVDWKRSESVLEELTASKAADLAELIALCECYARSGRAADGLRFLDHQQKRFQGEPSNIPLVFWRVQFHLLLGQLKEAGAVLDTANIGEAALDIRTTVLWTAAEKSGDWSSVIDHLEKIYAKTSEADVMVQICELKTRQQDWSYIADRAQLLVTDIATAEVLRVAAISMFNAHRYQACLDLLEQNRSFFRDGNFPDELRRARIGCKHALGTIPEALAESEALVRDDPSTPNLLQHAQLYLDQGDIKAVTMVLRQLQGRPDLPVDQLLRLARIAHQEDLPLAQALWHQAFAKGVPDTLVGDAVALGFQIGLDDELGPLLARIAELGQAGRAGVMAVPVTQLLNLAKSHQEQLVRLNEAYRDGIAPIHVVAGLQNHSLVDYYHVVLDENESSPDPARQFALLARHGGRVVPSNLPRETTNWSLCLDITSMVLAHHLGILPLVEASFPDLRLPADIVAALLYAKEKTEFHQPAHLANLRHILKLIDESKIIVRECQLPDEYDNQALVDEMGEGWVARFEYARARHGFVVDALPLSKRDLSGPPAALPGDFNNYVVNCRSIIEAMRDNGQITAEDFNRTLAAIGSEGQQSVTILPRLGQELFFDPGGLQILQAARILNVICDLFQVYIDPQEVQYIRGVLRHQDASERTLVWIDSLIHQIREGLARGKYHLVYSPSPDETEAGDDQVPDHVYLLCLRSVLGFSPLPDTVIWADDRYVTGYSNRDGMLIVGICEILMALVSHQAITVEQSYGLLNRLRAANVRYLPTNAGEVEFYIRNARVVEDIVAETRQLQIFRRYMAACLLSSSTLQRPKTQGGEGPNEDGEIAFLLGYSQAISGAIGEVWRSEIDPAVRRAKADWIIANLFVDQGALTELAALQAREQVARYLLAVSLSGLLSVGTGLDAAQATDGTSLRRDFMDWLWTRVLAVRFEADPLMRLTVSDLMKRLLGELRTSTQDRRFATAATIVVQHMFNDLPQAIRDEIGRDVEFMSALGFHTTVGLGEIRIDPTIYWRAASEAVNGRESTLISLVPQKVLTFLPRHNIDGIASFQYDDPYTGDRAVVVDPGLELLHESQSDLERGIKRVRVQFESANQDLDAIIASIGLIVEPEKRAGAAAKWRDASASVYYEKLLQQLTARDAPFTFDDFMPSSGIGLLRHYRIDQEPVGKSLGEKLSVAAETLIAEEGLLFTITRLARFPVSLPQSVFKAISELPPDQLDQIVKELLQIPASPLSWMHLSALLVVLSAKSPKYWRLAQWILCRLQGEQYRSEFDAYLSILRWVYGKMVSWPDAQGWDTAIKLAMTWAHAHQLYSILRISGAPLDWIMSKFGQATGNMLPELFNRNADLELDIANPKRIDHVGFVLGGILYVLSCDQTLKQKQVIRQLVEGLALYQIGDSRVLALPLMHDQTIAGNRMDSFLGGDRGPVLSDLLEPDAAAAASHDSLQSLVSDAIAGLQKRPPDTAGWLTLHAVLGTLPIYPEQVGPLTSVIRQTNFADLVVKQPQTGVLALQMASAQIAWINDPALREFYRGELLKVATFIGKQPAVPVDIESSEYRGEDEEIDVQSWLLQAATNLASAEADDERAAEVFGRIVLDLVNAYPGLAPQAWVTVQQIYERIPSRIAKHLSNSLISLRAINKKDYDK